MRKFVPSDRSTAEALELGSTITMALPLLRRLTEPSTPHARVRWYHARIPANALYNTVTFSPNTHAGRTPKQYPAAGVFAVSKAEIDKTQREMGGVHAVAYTLGSTVMVGMKLREPIFTPSEDDQDYCAAMGIGAGALTLTAGLWNPDTRQLTTPITPIKKLQTVQTSSITLDSPYRLI